MITRSQCSVVWLLLTLKVCVPRLSSGPWILSSKVLASPASTRRPHLTSHGSSLRT